MKLVRHLLFAASLSVALTGQAHVDASPQGRSPVDLARDTTSRPLQVLEFLGLEPGMVVLDVFAGDGFYSEIIAQEVGPSGLVYLHNNQGSVKSLPLLQQRLANNRLPNVIPLQQEIHQLLLAPESLDLILLVKVYHDFYYRNNGWEVSPEPALTGLLRLLKPGATLGIVDHVAYPGSGASAAQSLHRIDPVFARAELERFGFEFVAESELLLNPEDALRLPVFHADIRGRTSRFIQRYRKPAEWPPLTGRTRHGRSACR